MEFRLLYPSHFFTIIIGLSLGSKPQYNCFTIIPSLCFGSMTIIPGLCFGLESPSHFIIITDLYQTFYLSLTSFPHNSHILFFPRYVHFFKL